MRLRAPSPSRNHHDVQESPLSSLTYPWQRRSYCWYAVTFAWLIGQTVITILLSLDDVVVPRSMVLQQHETTPIQRAIVSDMVKASISTEKNRTHSIPDRSEVISRNIRSPTKHIHFNHSTKNPTRNSKQSFSLDPAIAYPAFVPEELHQQGQQQYSDYAFAFVIGGCDLQSGAYKGYLYTVMIAARLLQRLGSVADVVCFVQLKHDRDDTELPPHQVEWLRALGVHLYYIPKSSTESFYETVLNKFRILALEQYRRVILLDGDVIPVRNMDYLFALSDYDYHFAKKNVTRLVHPYNSTTTTTTTVAAATTTTTTTTRNVRQLPPRLRENVVVAGTMEPANGGFFMLAPKPGAYEELQHIVKKRAQRASQLLLKKNVIVTKKNGATPTSALFDIKEGWGHFIRPPDRWTTRRSNYSGTDWDFLFAYSDQGLLYHWTKYAKKDVSIVFQDYVENWSARPNGEVTLQETLGDEFFSQSTHGPLASTKPCEKFMCDFVHFSGRGKPWMFPPTQNHMKRPNRESFKSMIQMWWSTLIQLNDSLQMNLNFTNWDLSGTRPDFGFWAKHHDLNLHVYEAAKAH